MLQLGKQRGVEFVICRYNTPWTQSYELNESLKIKCTEKFISCAAIIEALVGLHRDFGRFSQDASMSSTM